MYCTKCGNKNDSESNFCAKCGHEIIKQNIPSNETIGKQYNKANNPAKKKSNFIYWLLWWRLDKEQINHQVESYNKINIWSSPRGISTLLIMFGAAITLFFMLFLNYNPWSLVDIIIMIIIAIFIYYGNSWAMILAMIFWTFEKIFVIISSPSTSTITISLIWWAIYMHEFYYAYKVEQIRRSSK